MPIISYLGEGTNTGSMFAPIYEQSKVSDEANHNQYLEQKAQEREAVKLQSMQTTDPMQRANFDIQYKTSLLGSYFKDKAYQNGKDRYGIADDEYVQQQMENVKSFPNASTEIMSYMNGGMDDKSLFKSLDKQYAQSNYVPKLADALRKSGFEGDSDMAVINTYLEKSGDKKARQDLVDIGVLDADPSFLDKLSKPGTSLIEYASTIKNPVISGLLSTIGQGIQGGERAFHAAIGEEEKLLQAAGLKQDIPNMIDRAGKSTVQNVAEIGLGTLETGITSKFPGMSAIFNVASQTPGVHYATDALGRLATTIGSPLEAVPGFNKLEPKQQEELKTYLGGFILGKTYSKITKGQGVTQTAIQKESAIQSAPKNIWENLATRSPAMAKVINFIESKLSPDKSLLERQKGRVEKIQTEQEGITSKILQPGEKYQKSVEATPGVFKTEKGSADFNLLATQTKSALEKKGLELETAIAEGDKPNAQGVVRPTVPDTKITEIATILQKKMSGDKTLKGTSEYEKNVSEINNLAAKAAAEGLTQMEKQKLKNLLDSEVNNLYDNEGKVKGTAIEEKTLVSYRSYLKKNIEDFSGNPEKVRTINKEYNSLRQANDKLGEIVRKLQSSNEAPGYIQETLSKFVVLNFLRKGQVKDVAFLNRELSKLVDVLEGKQATKETIKQSMEALQREIDARTIEGEGSLAPMPE